jgi:hypothetical protein
MRTRIAATAVAGALALGVFAAPAAVAATPAPVAPKLVSAHVNSLVFGLGGTFTINIRVAATDTDAATPGIKSIQALPIPAAYAKYGVTKDDFSGEPALKAVSTSATSQVAAESHTAPWTKGDHLPNALAGSYNVAVLITAKNGTTTLIPKATTFTYKRADVVSGKAVSTRVAKGRFVTLNGKLSRADWDKWVWQGYGYQKVALQYRKPGTSTWVTKKWVTSNSKGLVSAAVRDYSSGYWRFVYTGNAVSGAASSAQTWVTVK